MSQFGEQFALNLARDASTGQQKDKHGRHACNRSGDDGAYGEIMCTELPGREHGIYKASTEDAQRRK